MFWLYKNIFDMNKEYLDGFLVYIFCFLFKRLRKSKMVV